MSTPHKSLSEFLDELLGAQPESPESPSSNDEETARDETAESRPKSPAPQSPGGRRTPPPPPGPKEVPAPSEAPTGQEAAEGASFPKAAPVPKEVLEAKAASVPKEAPVPKAAPEATVTTKEPLPNATAARRHSGPSAPPPATDEGPSVQPTPATPGTEPETYYGRYEDRPGRFALREVILALIVAATVGGIAGWLLNDPGLPESGPSAENPSQAQPEQNGDRDADTETQVLPSRRVRDATKTYQQPDGLYSFRFPKSWSARSDGATARVESPDGHDVAVFGTGTSRGLDRAVADFKTLLRATYSQVVVDVEQPATGGPRSAVLIQGTMTSGGDDMSFIAKVVEGSGDDPSVAVLAVTDSPTGIRGSLTKVVLSFRSP